MELVWAMPERPPKATTAIARIYFICKERELTAIRWIPFVTSSVHPSRNFNALGSDDWFSAKVRIENKL